MGMFSRGLTSHRRGAKDEYKKIAEGIANKRKEDKINKYNFIKNKIEKWAKRQTELPKKA